MINRLDGRKAAALGSDDDVTQQMESIPAPDDAARLGQDIEGSADGAELTYRVDATVTIPSYRRSLFRR